MRLLILLSLFLGGELLLAEEGKKDDGTTQEESPADDEPKLTDSKNEPKKFSDKEERAKVKFRFIPGPTYDPSIGFELMLIPMFVYYPDKDDMVSPPSQTSAFYMVTSNKSMMGGISQMFYLKQDTWRVDFGLYAGRLNMDVDLKDSSGNF